MSRRLTVLSVGYALAPVGPDAVGGAEQVLTALDAALVAAGHRSLVIAPEGSRPAGQLIATAPVPPHIDDPARRSIEQGQRRAIAAALARWPIDVVHAHGVDFAEHLPAGDVPTLVTLHLPASFYPAAAFSQSPPNRWFNCVSAAQHRTFAGVPNLLDPIPNGVAVESLAATGYGPRKFALMLGRICPEKGVHLGIDAAAEAGLPLLIAGRVFPYDAHLRYFEEIVRPRLGHAARFLGSVGFRGKRHLLSAARGLLLPSLAPETSSLVAMEAAACGCPVVAFAAGALPDIVERGVSGFIVADAREMAAAIPLCDRLDRESCRAVARRRFRLEQTVERYFAVYERLAACGVQKLSRVRKIRLA